MIVWYIHQALCKKNVNMFDSLKLFDVQVTADLNEQEELLGNLLKTFEAYICNEYLAIMGEQYLCFSILNLYCSTFSVASNTCSKWWNSITLPLDTFPQHMVWQFNIYVC